MLKRIIRIFILVLVVFSFSFPVQAMQDDTITLYLFYGDGCPHCALEKELLEELKEKYDNFEVVTFEVWKNADNQEYLDKIKDELDIRRSGVPVTIIGDTYIVGYSESVGNRIDRAIKFYKENEYVDVIKQIDKGEYVPPKKDDDEDIKTEFEKSEEKLDNEFSVTIPLFGKVNLKDVSLTTAALVIGLVDGFNPCAMWILLFLISVLIGMKDKKRMLLIGLTFLVSSALVYMLIMLSWLNIVVSVSTSIWVRNIIAVVALCGGVINLVSYFKDKKSGCSVVDANKRKKIFSRIKKFTHEEKLILALIGTVALAFSVNIVELSCSAGLPVVFTQVLAINNITGVGAFFYVLLYIFFFLLDDLVVFFIAMYTMKVTGISTKYNRFSHLIGGILMLLIGGLLLFKPEWLMFQFK